jgi:hypothetical protein
MQRCLFGFISLFALPLMAGAPVLDWGGQIRQRYQAFENGQFGRASDDTLQFWLQRYRGDFNLAWSDRFSIATSLIATFDEGGDGDHSPVEENRLDWQQAFLDYGVNDRLDVSLGRMEWRFGSQRLIGLRDGTNVRRSFDGGLLTWQVSERWQAQTFWGRPTALRIGAFDDSANDDQALWGSYATYRPKAGQQWEFYYFGNRLNRVNYAQASGRETRHSLGSRWQADITNWDFNWEALYQFGEVGDQDIRAYTFASITGYRFRNLPWQPKLALSTNIASGDDNPGDDEIGTFRAMYPRGNYFSDAALLGPANFYNFHGFLTVNPLEALTITGDLNFYQRLETADGIYAPTGALLFEAADGNQRGVSRSWDLNVAWQPASRWTITAIFTQLDPRSAVEAVFPAQRMRFAEFTVLFKF